MRDLLLTDGITLILITAFFGYVLYLIINRRWEQLRALGYQLILQAEKLITGTQKGQRRFEFVLDRLYSALPAWLGLFITEEALRAKLQEWFNDIKDYMDNGQMDKSIQQ